MHNISKIHFFWSKVSKSSVNVFSIRNFSSFYFHKFWYIFLRANIGFFVRVSQPITFCQIWIWSPIFYLLIKEINHREPYDFDLLLIIFHASVLINSFVIFILLMSKPYYFNSMRNTDIHKLHKLIFYGQIEINILYVLSFYIQLWFSKLISFLSTCFHAIDIHFYSLTTCICFWFKMFYMTSMYLDTRSYISYYWKLS